MKQTLFRSILKIGAGYLVSHGIATQNNLTITWATIMAVVGVLWGLVHRSGPATSNASGRVSAWLLLGSLLLLGATGCHSTVTTGHVVSVTDRFVGLHYSQNTVNPTSPDVVFGFGSSTVVIMPTVTNQNLSVPAIANTFSMDQKGTTIMLPVINETFASGSYATGNATNNIQATPVIAK